VDFASSRVLLLLHDGELADVRALAESAGAEVIERRPSELPLPGAPPIEWDVLVVTGRYAKTDLPRGGREKAVRIAVLDRNMRSLRSVVRRAGVDLVVRRPVHPTALRLLLLHSLYRGPERRSRRVAIGTPVRFRAGLLRKDGVLTDLSLRGCQIVSRHTVRTGQSCVVWVPEGTQESKSFAVRGTVVRTLVTEGGERGFGVDFGKVSKDVAAHLKGALLAYAEGPAAVAGPDPGATQPLLAQPNPASTPAPGQDPNEVTGSGYRASGSREVVRVHGDFAGGVAAPRGDAGAEGVDGPERRTTSRHAYSGRRIVALGDEAARVLIGRDLSVGGMRVERAPNLCVGQRFQLAIHVAPGQTPLVVPALILRDDGERGFAVRFTEVSEPAARYLAKMVDSLPVLADGDAVVISQIVDPPA